MDHMIPCSRETWHCTDCSDETGQHCLFLHITWCTLEQSWSCNSDRDITITNVMLAKKVRSSYDLELYSTKYQAPTIHWLFQTQSQNSPLFPPRLAMFATLLYSSASDSSSLEFVRYINSVIIIIVMNGVDWRATTYCHCVCPSCLVPSPTTVVVLASCLAAAAPSCDHLDSYLQAANWPTEQTSTTSIWIILTKHICIPVLGCF